MVLPMYYQNLVAHKLVDDGTSLLDGKLSFPTTIARRVLDVFRTNCRILFLRGYRYQSKVRFHVTGYCNRLLFQYLGIL